MWQPTQSPADIAARLQGQRLVAAEFMYKPRPIELRERRVFDFTLVSRLSELSHYDGAAVMFVCDSQETIDSLAHLPAEYPRLAMLASLVNPTPVTACPDPYANTPQ